MVSASHEAGASMTKRPNALAARGSVVYTGRMKLFGGRRIYLDYAGATPVDAHAARSLAQALGIAGNPGALHAEGVEASRSLEAARESVAREFGCKPRQIIFVSGGTEANNLALLGLAQARDKRGESLEGTHWIVSSIEHPSVLQPLSEIERFGGAVSYVDPDARGRISPESVANLLTPRTVCVSVGWANSEIGVVQPLSDIARAMRAFEAENKTKIIFHSDAGQAPLYRATLAHSLGVDILTLDSGKLYGPRGIGALYISNRVELAALMAGGGQERGLRPGTENVALASGFAEALQQVSKIREVEAKRLGTLRDILRDLIQKAVPSAIVNGDLAHGLPHMLNISIPDTQSEYLTLALDHAGVAVATKSACREGEESRSHVVEALLAGQVGGETWRAENTLRFSLGRDTTLSDVKKTAEILAKLLMKKRGIGAPKRG